MDYSSYKETIIFRTAAILGFRRLQSYMLPCLYALLMSLIEFLLCCHPSTTETSHNGMKQRFMQQSSLGELTYENSYVVCQTKV